MSDVTSTKLAASMRVKITETIDPDNAAKFRYLHDSLAIKRARTVASGLAHSQTIGGNTTWMFDELTHPTGRVRDYTGKELKSITIVSLSDPGVDLEDGQLEVTITVNSYELTLIVYPGVFYFQQFEGQTIQAGDNIVFSTAENWQIILEFE